MWTVVNCRVLKKKVKIATKSKLGQKNFVTETKLGLKKIATKKIGENKNWDRKKIGPVPKQFYIVPKIYRRIWSV